MLCRLSADLCCVTNSWSVLCAGMVLPGAVGETQETQPRLRGDGRGRSPDRAAEVQGMVLFRQVSFSPVSTNL